MKCSTVRYMLKACHELPFVSVVESTFNKFCLQKCNVLNHIHMDCDISEFFSLTQWHFFIWQLPSPLRSLRLFHIIASSAVFTAVQIGPESRSTCFRSIYCILQLILCFYSPHLKKVLEMVSFGPQTWVMSNKVYCRLKLCGVLLVKCANKKWRGTVWDKIWCQENCFSNSKCMLFILMY